MRLLLALLGLPLLIPFAAAEDTPFSLVLRAPDAPLVPDGPPAHVDVTIRVDCALLSDPANRTLSLVLRSSPPWARADIAQPRIRVPDDACANQGAWSWSGAIPVRAFSNGTAFATSGFGLEGRLGNASGAWTAADEVPLREGFAGGVHVEAPTREGNASGGDLVQFPLVIENVGNGHVRVSVTVLSVEGDAQVAVPQPLTLGPAGDRSSGGLMLDVLAPERPGDASVKIRVQATSILDPRFESDPVDLTFGLHVRGSAVPGPSLPLVAGAVALALIARRVRS